MSADHSSLILAAWAGEWLGLENLCDGSFHGASYAGGQWRTPLGLQARDLHSSPVGLSWGCLDFFAHKVAQSQMWMQGSSGSCQFPTASAWSGTVLLLLNSTGQCLRLNVSLKIHHTDPQCYGIWKCLMGRLALGHLVSEMNSLVKETSFPSHHVGTQRKDGSLWIWHGLAKTMHLLSPWPWTP